MEQLYHCSEEVPPTGGPNVNPLSLTENSYDSHELDCLQESAKVNGLDIHSTSDPERMHSVTLGSSSSIPPLFSVGLALEGHHPAQRPQSSGILYLPAEILTQTFRYFQHPGIEEGRFNVYQITMDFTPYQHIVQNIRLVCRVFNIIASQFLLPVLHIWNDQRSLNRIRALVEAPNLMRGLHAIQVHMEYYFIEFVRNKGKFFTFARDEIWDLLYRISSSLDQSGNSDLQWSVRPEIILDRLRAVNSAAHYLLDVEPDEIFEDYRSDNNKLIEEYKEILERAYTKYRAKYFAHREIIKEKSIMRELSRLFTSLRDKQCLSLSFVQSQGKTLASGVEDGLDGVYQSLTSTHIWEHMGRAQTELEGREFARQAEILWDLPLAIHEAGGTLTSLNLCDILVTQDYSLFCSKKLSLPFKGPSDWVDLSKACQSLEIVRLERLGYNFQLGDDNLPSVRATSNLAEGLTFPLAEYLDVILSGRKLKNIALNTAIEEVSRHVGHRDRCPLGPVLGKLDCRFISIISLSNIGISQTELEQLCRNIRDMIEKISLTDITLTEGGWRNALDILREKLLQRCSKGLCTVHLEELAGGEIDPWMSRIKESNDSDNADETERIGRNAASKKIMDLLTGYVNGGGVDFNPIPVQNNYAI